MKRSTINIILVLFSTLILSILVGVINGGFERLLAYKHAMQPNLPVGSTNLRFFTKELIKRSYNKYTAKPISSSSAISSFRFFVDEADLQSLNSDLPSSGKTQYIPANLLINNEFSSKVDFRYRGGLPLHWLYDKKSVRVKLPTFVTFENGIEFNLVNPSQIETIIDWISYDMSKELGLLTPDYYPARVFFNAQYNGLHFFLSQVDESFLRKNNVMPGSIYSGDTLYQNSPFTGRGMNERTYNDKNGISKIWVDERLWQKDAFRNAESTEDRRDIKQFINTVNEEDPLSFHQQFNEFFDKKKYYYFWGLDTITGSFHHDLYHNQKMYFDPYKGRFEPIQWDLRFWAINVPIPLTPLMRNVGLNPVLEYEKDKTVYELLRTFEVENVFKRINTYSEKVREELSMDPYRQSPFVGYENFMFDKVLPYNMNQFEQSISDLKTKYSKRHELISRSFNDTKVQFVFNRITPSIYELVISIDGTSPVLFEMDNSLNMTKNIEVIRNHRATNQARVKKTISSSPDTLYPGRKLVSNADTTRMRSLPVIAFGREHLEASPLNYKYLVRVESDLDIDFSNYLKFSNAITGRNVKSTRVLDIVDTTKTDSAHPWHLEQLESTTRETVVLRGDVTITSDTIYRENVDVIIEPGTNILLAPRASIVFFGKVTAIGSLQSPIIFSRLVIDEAWGSIIVQGKSASHSHFEYIRISGGSITTHQLIDYPGMLNIHDVDDFVIANCVVQNNTIGDDAVHIAYSKGEIRKCRFSNTAFDALDMDIVDVKVIDSTFFDIGNDALDLMNSKVIVEGIYVRNAQDKCISVGEGSIVNVHNSVLKKCLIGIAIKDNSIATVDNILFRDFQESGLALYRKNRRYAQGGLLKGQLVYGISLEQCDVGTYSKIMISKTEFSSADAISQSLMNLEIMGDEFE